ncbi:Tim44/TimA family putative adaptor protein [Altererythrobacter sp. MTPC7]|uniref:Tim44/TimA family putative adaptor protein n=1 Tax=Altererythrobacter sp. MTPC7 TaxID=3056567 RepID=UPI0036F2363F
MIVEIVILAMIAAFLGLRLYSVLGNRAEHEEEAIPRRFDAGDELAKDNPPVVQLKPAVTDEQPATAMLPVVEQGVRAISAADRNFDVLGFIEGAKGAYGMILEAFWTGDKETLRELCDDDVYAGFAGAIDARTEAGETMDNTLIRIEDATIRDAELDGREARVTMRFVSDIAAVTRDRDGNLVAGSLDDAIESRDIWTFARNVDAAGPDWQLVETDEG